jgi:hypothetical protein
MYDDYGNGVSVWEEILSDGSSVYYIRMYGGGSQSFIQFACEDFTHAVSLANEMVKTVDTQITLEIAGSSIESK